jgi:hypothetical protein
MFFISTFNLSFCKKKTSWSYTTAQINKLDIFFLQKKSTKQDIINNKKKKSSLYTFVHYTVLIQTIFSPLIFMLSNIMNFIFPPKKVKNFQVSQCFFNLETQLLTNIFFLLSKTLKMPKLSNLYMLFQAITFHCWFKSDIHRIVVLVFYF